MESPRHRLLEPGTVLAGRWTVEKKLGDGGMASTYAVRSAKEPDGVLLALKAIDRDADRKHYDRLRAEFETLQHLHHAHVVRSHEWGEDHEEGIAFYVMEHVAGVTLTEYVRRSWLLLRETMEVFRQVLEAVAYLHRQGVTHRDLKPDNILVNREGQVTIIDFGICRGPHRPDITGKKNVSGTLLFVGPEQARLFLAGEKADDAARALAASPRADVYALGVLLYHLLTNDWPHRRPGAGPYAQREFLRRVCSHQPRPPPKVAGAVPPALALLAVTMLRPRAQERPATAGDVLAEFDAALKADDARLNETSPLVKPQFEQVMRDDGMVPTQPHFASSSPWWWSGLTYVATAAVTAVLLAAFTALRAGPPKLVAPLRDSDPAALSAPEPRVQVQVLAGIADAGEQVQRLLLGATLITGPLPGQKRYPCTRGNGVSETPWKGACWQVFAMQDQEQCDQKVHVVFEPEVGWCKKNLMGYIPVWLKDTEKPTPATLTPVEGPPSFSDPGGLGGK